MAYLVVDLAGNEYACDLKPRRVGHRKDDDINIYFNYYEEGNLVIGVNSDDVFNSIGSFEDLTNWEFVSYDDVVSLPMGTIKEITGQDITWETPPYKYNEFEVLSFVKRFGGFLIQ